MKLSKQIGTNFCNIIKLCFTTLLQIIVPHTVCENGSMTEMFKMISDHFNNTNIATVQKKYFNEHNGMHHISYLCQFHYDIYFGLMVPGLHF